MLKRAKANVFFGEAENLPFEDKRFDTVISVTAIQNVDDYETAINEIKRVAKNKIAISVLKKSEKIEKIKELLSDFETYEEDKDIIFYKLIKHTE